VQTLIGSPTTRAPFDDNTWIYIGELTKPVIGGTMEVLDQRVTVLTFDTRGVLRNVENKTQDDSRPVGMVSRSTPSPGSDPSILQQLLGNVGRFGPGGGIGGSGGTNGTNNRSGTGGSNF
jgi:outer membrane protein assembly factor BamE (lipoprotein component of BamABCDE complex)